MRINLNRAIEASARKSATVRTTLEIGGVRYKATVFLEKAK